MAGAQFSQQWWNDEALARGNRLTRADLIALSGITPNTVWNHDGTIGVFWYNDALNRIPGLKASGLLLNPGPGPGPGFDVHTVVGQPDYPVWPWFQSPVGFVAPGTTTPYTPVLATTPPPPLQAPPPLAPPAVPPPNVTPPPSQSPPPPPSVPTGPGPSSTGPTVNISGPLPPAPSSPAGSSPTTLGGPANPTTVALTNAAPSTTTVISDSETDAFSSVGTGFPAFLPNVPRVLVVGGVVLLLFLLLSNGDN